MLCRLLLLSLLLSPALPAYAGNCDTRFAQLAKQEKFIAKFRAEADDYEQWLLEHPSATKRQLAIRIKKHIEKTSEHLRKMGVAHEIQKGPRGVDHILILPGDGSLYNRYALGILKYDETLKVMYDPYQLHRDYTTAMFVSTEGVYASLASIIRASPKEEAMRHETIHAAHDFFEQIGRLGVIHSTMEPAAREAARRSFRMPGPPKGYANFLAMDEMITYQSTLKDTAKAYTEAIIQGDGEALNQTLTDWGRNRGVFGRLQDRVGEINRYVDAATKNARSVRLNSGHPSKHSFKIDGKLFHAETRADTFQSSYPNPRKPYIEYAEIIVREAPKTVLPGERPIGFTLTLPLRQAEKEGSRDVLPEIRAYMEDSKRILGLARGQRAKVIQVVEAIEAAAKRGASEAEFQSLLKDLNLAAVMRR